MAQKSKCMCVMGTLPDPANPPCLAHLAAKGSVPRMPYAGVEHFPKCLCVILGTDGYKRLAFLSEEQVQ